MLIGNPNNNTRLLTPSSTVSVGSISMLSITVVLNYGRRTLPYSIVRIIQLFLSYVLCIYCDPLYEYQ